MLQAAVEGLRGEVKSTLATLRREWEVAVETAAVRHAEQMAEGRAREERLKSMRCARVRVCICSCYVRGACEYDVTIEYEFRRVVGKPAPLPALLVLMVLLTAAFRRSSYCAVMTTAPAVEILLDLHYV